ncbi:hypothetical protein HYS94_01730 [Candidatus Daviesbacteria bacterium]|nr:hypothetical protein [Candidatus Daviesbacteria bacterium]
MGNIQDLSIYDPDIWLKMCVTLKIELPDEVWKKYIDGLYPSLFFRG